MTFEPATLFAIFFYAFAGILVLAALQVIISRNPVNSALFLMLSFFCASGLWMLLRAEFLSLVLILVYVGAVMVLFLFVVMMLDLDLAHLRRDFKKYLPVAFFNRCRHCDGAIDCFDTRLYWHNDPLATDDGRDGRRFQYPSPWSAGLC